nr:hypothetical protein [Candidatus Sigynarchaeum springense]
MLDEYCKSLPEHAQVAMSMQLIEIVLPTWEKHVTEHPDDLARVNALVTEKHKIFGGLAKVAASLPRAAVNELKKMIASGRDLASSSSLRHYLATFMQPLTNPDWDGVLPEPVGLVFTATWNLLTYLLLRQKTKEGETHVYVAINQACDAILREKLLSQGELDRVLEEYRGFKGKPLVNSAREANKKEEGSTFPSIRRLFASMYSNEIQASCPECGSSNVSEEPLGIEFAVMKCHDCGNEDTCDVWQLDDWYR